MAGRDEHTAAKPHPNKICRIAREKICIRPRSVREMMPASTGEMVLRSMGLEFWTVVVVIVDACCCFFLVCNDDVAV